MLRVLLIRPGTTDYDEQGRIKGRLDIPLNRQGMDQLARTVREVADQAIEIIYAALRYCRRHGASGGDRHRREGEASHRIAESRSRFMARKAD